MKHSATQEIFSYWNTLRAARPAPSRNQINPVAIPKILPDIFLLESDDKGQLVFRLAGTRLCALFGRELKGESFLNLWGTEGEYNMADLMGAVLEERAAVVAGAEGFGAEERVCNLELILLPLDNPETDKTRIVGCLSASPLPTWFSIHPLSQAVLTTTRICWPSGRKEASVSHAVMATNDDTPLAGAVYASQTKVGGFIVYEGGRQK